MKKIFFSIFILLFLTSCFNKKIEEEKINTGASFSGTIKENLEGKTSYEGIYIDLSEKNLEKERNKITLNDIDLISNLENNKRNDSIEEKNNLLSIGKKFQDNLNKTKEYDLTKNINGGISFENLKKEFDKLPLELKRNFDLDIEIFDYETKKVIDKGEIFINGVNLGEFEKGKFKKEFFWAKGIENFTIMARSSLYGDGFIRLNSINSEGSYLKGKIFLKKLTLNKKTTLDKEVILDNEELTIKIPKCSLVNSKGNCFKGKVETKINFISGKDVNSKKVSLNMKALTKEGKIVDLKSGGMAFTEFITEDGEILQVGKDKTIEITYKVDEKTILDMENTLYGQGNKNGYWLYDKNKNIWLEKDAKIKIDKKNKTWTAIVSEIY